MTAVEEDMMSAGSVQAASRRRPVLWWIALAVAAIACLALMAERASAQTIAFLAPKVVVQAGAPGVPADFKLPTAAEVDPVSGRLFVATQCGKIYAFDLSASNDAAFAFQLNQVNDYPNFGFDGTTPKPNIADFVCGDGSGNEKGRQTVGLTFDPNPPAGKTVLYVSHSDPDIFTNKAPNQNTINPSSGVVSKFVIGGAAVNQVESFTDVVVGLPRSGENHSVNGMDVGPDGQLYVSIGGNTNQGGKSLFFSWFPETHHAGTVVKVNTAAIGNGPPVDVTPYNRFTFNDNGTPPSTSLAVPVGQSLNGNVPGKFELFATGFRNGYDIVWHSNGQLYLNDNEGNNGFGGTPGSATGDNTCPGAGNVSPGTPPDELHLVSPGTYHGHPNPANGNCNYEGPSGGVFGANFQQAIFEYTPFKGTHRSLNALVEYTSPAFAGALQGQLITTSYSVTPAIYRLKLNAAGNAVVDRDKLADLPGALGAAIGVDGTIFATSILESGPEGQPPVHTGRVIAYVPDDIGLCPKPGNPATTDSDGDGFTDRAEDLGQSNKCSKASTPADSDKDGIPDGTDPDDDNDGIPDVKDQLQLDKDNGKATKLPLKLSFNATAGGGFFGTGFTGVQLSDKGGIVPGKVGAGAAGGFLQMVTSAGTNRSGVNSQDNAMQVGIPQRRGFVAEVKLGQPFLTDLGDEDGKPEGNESAGLYFGTDQDNFVQVGISANNGSPVLELGKETKGTFARRPGAKPLALPTTELKLTLFGDYLGREVEARVQTGNAAPISLGRVAVPKAWFDQPVLIGLAGTSAGSPEEQAYVFDDFTIDRLVPGANCNLIEGDNRGQVLRGTKACDKIRGFGANDRLIGRGGGDFLYGENGSDRIDGNGGDDRMFGGRGVNRMFGGVGNDIAFGGVARDIIAGGPGNDRANGGRGNDLLMGQGGKDTLNGQAGNDVLVGGASKDILNGGVGRDRLLGGGGRDTIRSRDKARDFVDCGPGRDTAIVDRRDVVRNCEKVRRGR